ncbi:MAG: beta strand repeat-containing protein, partial [Betaproteobacteria bacterium]
MSAALMPWAWSAYAQIATNTLPTGGNVVAGSASITQNAAKMNVAQGTNSAIINWQSFSIGSGAHVNFAQPSASAIALNRVVGTDPSQIFGRLTANGQVFLTNPGGVLFARGAAVDVGGLLATTLSIADRDFLSGRYNFINSGGAGSVVNEGTIITANGYTALAGPQVRNDGLIVARAGSVALAGADRISLDMVGDGLISVKVEQAALNASAINTGTIEADGGQVLLTAQSANALLDTVVNNSGVIRANTIVQRNGQIILDGGSSGVTSSTGTLQAAGVDAGTKGGTVKVLGKKVGLFGVAIIDASGDAGGGTVLVGGNFQGKGPEQNAERTFIGKDAQIKADAGASGDGGKVIVWADDVTRFNGSISARGGQQGGDGGFVEVSGKGTLHFNGRVDLAAPQGKGGTLLLDPANIEISTNADTNTAGFTAGTDNTEAFADDDNTNSVFNVNTSFTGVGNGATITLEATNDINVITNWNIATSTTNTNVSVVLRASNSINVGTTAAATITASGTGTITLHADADSSGTGATGAAAPNGIGSINRGSATPVGGLVTANQPITLRAADIAIDATQAGTTVNAGTSTVNVFSSIASRTIGVGTVAADLTVGNAELGKITAGTLVFGDGTAQTGNITFAGATPAAGQNVTAAQLTSGGGGVVLDDALANALTTGAGNVSLTAGTAGITQTTAAGANSFAAVSSDGTITLNTQGTVGTLTSPLDISGATPNVAVGTTTAPSALGAVVVLRPLVTGFTIDSITTTNREVGIANSPVDAGPSASITVAGAISTGTGPISIQSTGALAVNGAITTTGAGGTITLFANTAGADADSFTQTAAVTSGDTGLNAVRIRVNEVAGSTGTAQLDSVSVGALGSISVNTTGSTGLATTGGSITQTDGKTLSASTGAVTLTVGAAGLGGIGAAGPLNDVNTTAATVTATAGSGGVFVTESDGAGFTASAQGAGNIVLASTTGALTIAGATSTGAGSITLTASAGDVVLNNTVTTGNVTVAGTTPGSEIATTASISVTAGGAISGNASGRLITGNAEVTAGAGTGGSDTASSGSITLNAAGAVQLPAANALTIGSAIVADGLGATAASAGSITVGNVTAPTRLAADALTAALDVSFGAASGADTNTQGLLNVTTSGGVGNAGGIFVTSGEALSVGTLATSGAAGQNVSISTTG